MRASNYTVGATPAEAISLVATYEEGIGWSLVFRSVRPTEGRHVTTRMQYKGLTSGELVDVVDVELAQALRLI